MGFESFQIVLRGGRVSYHEAAEIIRKLPNIKPDQGFLPEPLYFLMDDGRHVIEVELDGVFPLRISCRFILSHPPSIDATFLSFVGELMAQTGAEATICEKVLPDHEHPFSFEQFAEFAAATSLSIAAKRKEWISMMGPKEAATRQELYERIILPFCEPVAKT